MKELKFNSWTLFTAVCLFTLNARAWDGTGHMTVAELAWRGLSASQRNAISDVLRHHPHYAELLEKDWKPSIDHDEWVFLRAATWPDLVRPSHPPTPAKPVYFTQYHRESWHFIDLPYILPADQGTIVAAAHNPPVTNAVERLAALEVEVKSPATGMTNRAIALCWYLHLVGDVHQPLHCASWFSAEFSGSDGDRGGNRVAIKPGGAVTNLHSFWDGLLGDSTSYTYIDHTADAIEGAPSLAKAKLKELKNHKTYQSWADESFDYAGAFAYLDGHLAHAKEHDGITAGEVPDLNQNYESSAQGLAQRRVAVAGIRLGQKLKGMF